MKLALFSIALVLFFNTGSPAKFCSQNTKSVCLLPKDPGPCKAYFPRYYFDKTSGKCKTFIYGGCQGNGNNFQSRDACETRCTCFFPKKTGPCKAYMPRYHFNHCTGRCEQFIYGGCSGNVNNFESEKDCYKTCPYRPYKG